MDSVRIHTEFIGDRPPPPAAVMLRVDHAIVRGANQIGDVLVAAVRSLMAPNAKSARSMHSVTADVDHIDAGHVELGVGSSDPAVKWMTEGTGIYGPRKSIIRPITAKVMKFPHRGVHYGGQVSIRGAFAYASWIKGIRPRNYFERAHQASAFAIEAVINHTGNQIADAI